MKTFTFALGFYMASKFTETLDMEAGTRETAASCCGTL
jgi:hypothetical protein